MNNKPKSLIIAVDGYSSTGKSTVAKQLAARLGYVYIDTGAMYRTVTLHAMREGWIVNGEIDEKRLREGLLGLNITFRYDEGKKRYETYLNGEYVEEQIRGMEVSGNVSAVSSIGFVRAMLVEKQREMGRQGGVVMDGRDIGSVVFPDAEIKFFMTAAPEVRAKRRYEELKQKGQEVPYEEVEANVKQRDYMDEHRKESPLKKTEDAILIDNSNMTVEEEIDYMLEKIREKQ
ncbi:(d)CMP kinase [Odoribacter lunatus]|uniref:(d)CMP kinase n=1 Tax=Odoribacter lunatus TaxID=2941335 RepID=UPI0020426424|nr:(d)CMP kinase [Odoribacter lunatus]